MKKTIFLTFLLLAVQAVAFGQADSCFTLFVQPTLLGYPYNGIFPITVENQTQGTTFTLEDSLLHNCDLTGVAEHDAARFSLSSCHPNPCEGKANVTLTTDHDGDVLLQLFDVQGRLKAASTVLLERGAHTVEVSLSGRGLHILRATSHGLSVYAKIVNLASSKANNAIRIGASVSIPQEGKGVQTQQNVNIGDKLSIRLTLFSHVIDSVRSGLFVAREIEGIYWRFFENNPDTLFWNENSLKYRLVAIPLPYKEAFLDDYNPNHLIWRYIDFEDSTFYVYPNPSCPVTEMPMYVNNFTFENGLIRPSPDGCERLARVWPLSPGLYKYRITQFPSDNDIYCPECQGQLEVYSQDGTFLMSRILLLRRAVFPNVFILQKGHASDDGGYGWDEAPPYIHLNIVR